MTAGVKSKSKAGFVYVLSNQAMPGIVKIGMTLRNPDIRLKEINSATGVLPFAIEAVIASRNAKWTEREVHSRLSGKRVRENREFFKIRPDEARKLVFDVARNQRQKVYGGATWRGQSSLLTVLAMAFAILPLSWAIDPLLAGLWVTGCGSAMVLRKPRFLREYLTMNVGWLCAGTMIAVGVGASMFVRPEWVEEAVLLAKTIVGAV